MNISIIIPAKNEERGLNILLPQIKHSCPNAEIIVVNDGSNDNTDKICEKHEVRVVQHPYSMGNGAAVKSGVRAAKGDYLVFMDADQQHDPSEIPKLINRLTQDYDMIVGVRNSKSHTSIFRRFANKFYNLLASWIVGHKVEDLTSGFRVARANKFKEFLFLLPNGFSYPTTITMSFFRAGYPICYQPIKVSVSPRKSHLNPIKDGIRFLLIIFRVGTLYSPLKLFVPISFVFLTLGLAYYLYTYITVSRFTNMSGLLFITSVIIFLIGLVSEQITNLLYSSAKDK